MSRSREARHVQDKAYQALLAHIRHWIFGMPDSLELMPLLRLLLTEDEASFLARFPHRPHTRKKISELLGIPVGVLHETMDTLIRRGMICEIQGKSNVRYSFTDPIFFAYRMPGWQGRTDEFNEKSRQFPMGPTRIISPLNSRVGPPRAFGQSP